jgi:two-component system NtrC family response regulator
MTDYNLLIIDDEQSQRELLSGYLKKKDFNVYTADSGSEGIKIVNKNNVDIIFSDYKMPEMTGLEVLEKVVKINPEISFVIITAFGTVENAVKAMRVGAYDYISKPVDLDELDLLIERIIERKNLKSENQFLKTQLQKKHNLTSVISQSSAMEEVLSVASRAAESKATVLITGENGTGKEIVAKAIHYASPRKDKPIITVNIPALSENLVESELFGHEKGAFTSADKMKKGRFEIANRGTIFLDEIGDITPNTQVKLLRTLQEHTIERVGGTESIEIDVRILAATNQDLEKKIEEGTFREDLFYRLNIVRIHVPALNERREDILPLIEYFLQKFGKENVKENVTISKEATDKLLKYNYPGNVRELENIIERAVVLSRSNVITESDLSMKVTGLKNEGDLLLPDGGTLVDQVEALEKKLIYDARAKVNGNQTKAGKLLGLTERNLRYKLKKYDIKN